MCKIHQWLIQIQIWVAYQPVDLLRILNFIEERQDVSKANACIAIRLVVSKDVQILVVCFHQKSILFIVVILYVDGLSKCDVGQTQETIGVIAYDSFQNVSEFEWGFVDFADVEQEFCFLAELVDRSFCFTLACFVNPLNGAVRVASFLREVG